MVTPAHSLLESPSKVQRFYRPELDVLRFVAFLCVFTIHALGMSANAIRGQRIIAPIGAYGMCLFFFERLPDYGAITKGKNRH